MVSERGDLVFKINLLENASTAFQSALEALNKIIDGEVTYQNYRLYVLNLHSSLELFFKKKLYDYNEFMLFSFNKYDSLMEKFKKAYNADQSIFEYVESNVGAKLPNTVSFQDAYERLAYLFKQDDFDKMYIYRLGELNKIRNNIIHFELNLEEDQFVLLNTLFLKCVEYYEEYNDWGYELPFDKEKIIQKNNSLLKIIVNEPFNNKLLLLLHKEDGLVEDFLDFGFLADGLIEQGYYNVEEKLKLTNRLKVFENAGLFGYSSASGEHWDVGWFYLNEKCLELLMLE